MDKDPPVREVESGQGNPMTEFTGEEVRVVFFLCSGSADSSKDELGEYGGRISVLDGLGLSIKPDELIDIQGANGVW